MIFRLILALLAFLAPVSAQAQEAQTQALEGRWALVIDSAAIFVFTLDRAEDGEWHGTWLRPDTFASNGAVFARMVGERQLASSAGIEDGGDVEVTFDDPAPGAIPDIFRFRRLGERRAQLTYVGTPLAPYPLIAVAEGVGLGPFANGRVYDRDNAVSDPALAPAQARTPTRAAPPTPPVAEDPEDEGLGADFLEGL